PHPEILALRADLEPMRAQAMASEAQGDAVRYVIHQLYQTKPHDSSQSRLATAQDEKGWLDAASHAIKQLLLRDATPEDVTQARFAAAKDVNDLLKEQRTALRILDSAVHLRLEEARLAIISNRDANVIPALRTEHRAERITLEAACRALDDVNARLRQ